ncbi:hypothetical protein BGP_6096 [Beggiatoa sp. PS]|nr:hypothetical protein BGP_6096 [Beggiatoa sp. PS]
MNDTRLYKHRKTKAKALDSKQTSALESKALALEIQNNLLYS